MAYLSSLKEQPWTSDSSSDDSSYSEVRTPKTQPMLSLYQRELTDRRSEILELRGELSAAREENVRLERALAMRQLNTYEVESELREALDRCSAGERMRGRDRLLGSPRWSTCPPLSRYEEPTPSIDRSYLRGDTTLPHRTAQPPGELELVRPLTYRKRTIVPGRWITHTPYEGNYYGLFQQQKVKGKQVTHPSKRDLVGKKHPKDKYVISHQQATPDGSHLVTTLYKGNVNPTRSGGAQVRFTETEVLHQHQEARGFPPEPVRPKQVPPPPPPPQYRLATLKDTLNTNKKSNFPTNKMFGNKLKQKPHPEQKVRFATIKDVEDTPTRQAWYKDMV